MSRLKITTKASKMAVTNPKPISPLCALNVPPLEFEQGSSGTDRLYYNKLFIVYTHNPVARP